MTFGDMMVRFYLTYLAVFTTVSAFFMAVGVLIGCWVGADWQRRRRKGVQVDDAHLLDAWAPAFEPGVARVER